MAQLNINYVLDSEFKEKNLTAEFVLCSSTLFFHLSSSSKIDFFSLCDLQCQNATLKQVLPHWYCHIYRYACLVFFVLIIISGLFAVTSMSVRTLIIIIIVMVVFVMFRSSYLFRFLSEQPHPSNNVSGTNKLSSSGRFTCNSQFVLIYEYNAFPCPAVSHNFIIYHIKYV
jgi:hypothetical protein